MQRERWNTAAAPRDRPVGVAVGTKVGRAVASEENCARFNESQGVDKEPVPLTSGLTHEYNSDFPPEGHVRFRRVRNRRDRSAYEREHALPCLYFAPNRPRSDGSEALRRKYHRLGPASQGYPRLKLPSRIAAFSATTATLTSPMRPAHQLSSTLSGHVGRHMHGSGSRSGRPRPTRMRSSSSWCRP